MVNDPIVIIEDNEVDRVLVCDMLQFKGCGQGESRVRQPRPSVGADVDSLDQQGTG